jgi:thiol-disulfide isomerase/thioredoxin
MMKAKHVYSSALAAAVLYLAGATASFAQVKVGDAFPSLASVGQIPDTAGKVVLVDFWASWCAPCKASFPAYGRIAAKYGPQGLAIIAVSVDQDPDAYGKFVKRFQPPFFVALDKDQSLVSRVRVPTMPTSYLIDRQGRVRFLHPGFHGEETEKLISQEIETLLAEKAS